MSPLIEPLEARIAPAAVVYPTIIDAENDPTGKHFVSALVGTPVLLKAGDVLTTGSGPRSGSYMLFVEKGQALVFTTDLNFNNRVDYNEITGIAAGDGLRLLSFVDIHGDIVTNLRADGTLSDSNNNSADDDVGLKGDGRVLLNSRIEKIELRSLTVNDITDQNQSPGGTVDEFDVGQRLIMSTYSIFGSVLAGGGFGVKGDDTSGLIIDDAGRQLQATFFVFAGPFGPDYYDEAVTPLKPHIGNIKVGTAASGEYFSFGVTKPGGNDTDGNGDITGRDVLRNGNDTQGILRDFTPVPGQAGAGIFYVRSAAATAVFDIGQLVAGDGGIGAAGGNIENVTLNGDTAGGYVVQAGNGGSGANGGVGGSILEFSDLSSNTSEVTIRSGNGGSGSTGSGGNAGQTTFTDVNLLGAVTVDLGDGGTGFTAGGRGAGLEKAVMGTPDRLPEFVNNIVGTTHDTAHDPATGRRIIDDPSLPGVIGQSAGVDFDGDGVGDIVVSSSDPSQLFVQFMNADGSFRIDPVTLRPDRIYLDAPIAAEAITIGDFDGDGHMDVAAASSAQGSHGGIYVFLSLYEDKNSDGLTTSEDTNKNGFNDLVGFRSVRYSAIPELVDSSMLLSARRSAHGIYDLEAGDFDGDGFTDLAVAATFYSPGPVIQPFQVLIFMKSDVEDGKPTGQFYADFGTKGQAVPPISPNPFVPAVVISARGDTQTNIEVSALSKFADHDIVAVMADNGAPRQSIQIYDNSVPNGFGPAASAIPLGKVDTNRAVPTNNPNISLADANGHDLAMFDFDGDMVTDFTVLVEEPAGFLLTFQGDGLGGGARIDLPFLTPANSNAGFYFGPDVNGAGGAKVGTEQLTFREVDADGDGFVDEIAVLENLPLPARTVTAILQLTVGFPDTVGTLDNPGAAIDTQWEVAGNVSTTIYAFDAWHPIINDPTIIDYAAEDPETSNIDGENLIYSGGDTALGISLLTGLPALPFFVEVAEHFFDFHAGRGGDSLVGRGGDGGSLGGAPINAQTLVGSIDIHTNLGTVSFFAGDGGNGFTAGGKGGSVQGTLVDGSSDTLNAILASSFTAGNGGIAVSGPGGNGGNLIGNSGFGGILFTAGNGGRGIVGGNGGSVIGHGIGGLFDTQSLDHDITAGSGGNGIKRGGNGGDIINFHASLDLNATFETGTIIYLGGNGGSAVSGPGGRGGNVTNTSPIETDQNQLAGDIYLAGGRGGNGLVGGNGGSVDTFVNTTDQTQVPAIVSFLGGDGGSGTKGRGGNGGSVFHIDTASTGFPNLDARPSTAFTFDRVVAGRGGDSAGNRGGNGGNVGDIKISAQQQSIAIAAGAGGDALFIGGKGGSVSNSVVQVGNTPFSKAVVIAGQGGDANAYIANALDPAGLQTAIKAFGGRIGKGGNGGGITNISQVGGVLSRIDFIAGNGGDTVNYGTLADFSSKVGKGGSVKNISAVGSIGNFDIQVPIKSYNDVRSGETMDDFVQGSLRNEAAPGSLGDETGNVGIVVGAAGRIKQAFGGYDAANQPLFPSKPAAKGVNGSLINVEASAIMAAVAGSVERIAAIQSVQNIFGQDLPGGGHGPITVGVDKPGDANYLDKNANPTTTPTVDGILIDGAMASKTPPVKTVPGKKPQPINLGNRVFPVG